MKVQSHFLLVFRCLIRTEPGSSLSSHIFSASLILNSNKRTVFIGLLLSKLLYNYWLRSVLFLRACCEVTEKLRTDFNEIFYRDVKHNLRTNGLDFCGKLDDSDPNSKIFKEEDKIMKFASIKH